MTTLSFGINLFFVITTLITVFIFWKAALSSKLVLIIILVWLVLQSAISLTGFYKVVDTAPPRFGLLILPPLLLIISLFLTKKGRAFIDTLDIRLLTLLHVVRIPVEISIFILFIHKMVPEIMTFEGRNLDIISGITAPVIYYFGFVKRKISRGFIIAWNIICIGLLLNIVVIAILSAPFTFQRLAFDQPNIGLLIFPFVWLPCCIVPIVLFSHLASLRQLIRKPEVHTVAIQKSV